MNDTRRGFIKKGAALTALSATGLGALARNDNDENPVFEDVAWPLTIGAGMPKLCVGANIDDTAATMRKYKQIGIDHVVMSGPKIPWREKELREILDRFKANGLTVINMMISGHPKTIFGQDGRDEEIRMIKESLIAAGKVGLPVVEYNFYAHRLVEGYYLGRLRGGAGGTAFDYDKGKNIPLDPTEGKAQTAEMLWEHLTYFLKAVIPVAEKAGVRMALHPNDPPIPVTHGHEQIINSFKNWQRLVNIVDSPSNGMTYDCGVSREMGEDPIEILQYLAARDRINHVHYRNVNVEKPYVKYQEGFIDEGQVNLYAVMRELLKAKYKFGIYPEHPRVLDYDTEHDAGKTKTEMYPNSSGGYAALTYNVAYAKAMIQAVISAKQA